MPMNESQEQWRRLRSARLSDGDLGMPSVELSASTAAGALRLAVGSAGEALLLTPLGSSVVPADLPESRALAVREAVYVIRGAPTRFLELACTEGRLEGVFEQVVEEVARRVEDGESPVPAVSNTIDEFRDLLERRGGALSIEALTGLLGELLTLDDLLETAPTAWRAWAGPAGGRHDFRVGPTAVECKTSRRSAGGGVTISSVDQLDPPAGGTLVLRAMVVEPDTGGNLSVGMLARRVLEKASEPGLLRETLERAGWSADAPEMEMSFSLFHDDWYRVIEGFPRIVPASFAHGLPAGITGVTYTIHLSAAESFRMPSPESVAVLESLAHAA